MEHESQIGGPREFLTILFKHQNKILLVFLCTVITVTAGTFLHPPVYEAKSSVLVKFGREHIYTPEVGDTRQAIPYQSFNQEEAIRSEIEILTSKDLIEKVIKAIGVNTLYPGLVKNPPGKITPLEAAIPKFEKKISVEGIKKSNVIEIFFRHRDPEIAAMAVNQLVEFFKEKHLQVLSNPKPLVLEKQLTTYQQKLEESENNLAAFKQKYHILDLDEQKSLLLNQRIGLDTSLKSIQSRTWQLKQMLSSPESKIIINSKNIPFFPETEQYKIIDDAKANLLTLQLREQELLGKFKHDSRTVANLRKEIHLVKEFINEQERKLVEAELASLKSHGTTVKKQLNRLDKELRTLDLAERELQILKREVATNEKNYKIYLGKFEQARISEELDRQKIANIGVIQEAFVPSKPIRPRKGLNILLGIILGALSGLGFAFFSEYLSHDLSTPVSAESRLGLPVLTSFCYSCTREKTSYRKEKTTVPLLKWGLGASTTFFLILGGIFCISPYKDMILSMGGEPDPSVAINKKPVISEVQKEVPSLEVKSSSAQSTIPVQPAKEAFVKKERITTPWVINMSSVVSKQSAIQLLDRIQKDGYNGYITRFKNNDKLWYRVRIGFFPTREDARMLGENLSAKYSLHDIWTARASRGEILKNKKNVNQL